jgi:hypothetical protein
MVGGDRPASGGGGDDLQSHWRAVSDLSGKGILSISKLFAPPAAALPNWRKKSGVKLGKRIIYPQNLLTFLIWIDILLKPL